LNYIKRILHTINILRRYRFWGKKVKPGIIFFIDRTFRNHGGFSDRIKQILGIYAYCKMNDISFGLIHNQPFELSTYLKPKYNWEVSEEEIGKNLFYSKPVYLGKCSEEKQEKLLRSRTKQLHLYVNSNWSMFIRKGNYTIGNLFNELFIPIPEISDYVIESRKKYHYWDSVVFRFQSLLGDFNESSKNLYSKTTLNEREKFRLKEICYEYVKKEAEKKTLLVCSDSITFLKMVRDIPNVIFVPGELIHMDFTQDNNYQLHLKSFRDFFMISESDTIKSVGTKFMYPTNFPKLAADLKGKKFDRVLLEW